MFGLSLKKKKRILKNSLFFMTVFIHTLMAQNIPVSCVHAEYTGIRHSAFLDKKNATYNAFEIN